MLGVHFVTTVNTLTPYITLTLMLQNLLAYPFFSLEVATLLVTILSCAMIPAALRDSVERPPPPRDMTVIPKRWQTSVTL